MISFNGARSEPLSPGDEVEIKISDDNTFSGEYTLNHEGFLHLPFIDRVQLSGLSVQEAEDFISTHLIKQQIFQPSFLRLSLKRLVHSPIDISVSGAVFNSGLKMLTPSDANKRSVSMALLESGGVTPYADLTKIEIRRGESIETHNMLAFINGTSTVDPSLISGDHIFEPSKKAFNPDLVKDTNVTASYITVYLAGENAGFSKVIPYGSRLSHASVLSRCVGGSKLIYSPRSIVLARPNHVLRETEVSVRSVDHIMRNPLDDVSNPYLMPEDTVICFESPLKSVSDLFSIFGRLVSPSVPVYDRITDTTPSSSD